MEIKKNADALVISIFLLNISDLVFKTIGDHRN